MLEQTSLPNEKLSLHLQVETDQAALSQDVTSRRSTRFLWTGFGFAVLILFGSSVLAGLPLASHAFVKASAHFFSPSLPAFSRGGIRPVMHPGSVRARPTGFRPALPSLKQRQPLRAPRVRVPAIGMSGDEVSSPEKPGQNNNGLLLTVPALLQPSKESHWGNSKARTLKPHQNNKTDGLKKRRAYLLKELDDVTRALGSEATSAAVGSRQYVFEPSFGYLSQSAGVYTDEPPTKDGVRLPSNVLDLAIRNFGREMPNMLKFLNGSQKVESPESKQAADMRAKLDMLVLDNDKVWAREKNRPEVQAPIILLAPYYVLCFLLDVAFESRPIARFWFLETVARMPYFAYISSLHLYESLGWWRRSAETKRIHFAEEWNEFHHLLTMEALGGDQLWQDRFLAQHAAIVYYWVLVGVWFASPSLAYKFSELIEAHAVDTYGEFVDANRELLSEMPAPRVAREYYNGEDLHIFDEFQTSRPKGSRRVSCETLLDVFENIRDDESEHVATMVACQNPAAAVRGTKVESVLLSTALIGSLAVGLLEEASIGDAIASVMDIIGDAFKDDLLGRRLDPHIGAAEEGDALPEAGLSAIGSLARQTFEDARKGGKVNLMKDSNTQLLRRVFGSGP